MGLAARVIWISQSISGGNTIESWTLRGRETVLESHAGKVGHANAVRLKSTASRTPSRMESRVRGNVQARFGEGDTPYPQGSTVPTLPMVRRHFNARKQVGIYPRKETI